MEEEILTPKREMVLPIIITQVVCVAVMIVTVLTVKFFFKDIFKEVKNWYADNMLIDTSISDVETGE